MVKYKIIEHEDYNYPFLTQVNGDQIHGFDTITESEGKYYFGKNGNSVMVLLKERDSVVNLEDYKDMVSDWP